MTNTDRNEARRDMLVAAVYYIQQAIEELGDRRGEFGAHIDDLADIAGELSEELDSVESEISADWENEMAGMTRDYYRSVI